MSEKLEKFIKRLKERIKNMYNDTGVKLEIDDLIKEELKC